MASVGSFAGIGAVIGSSIANAIQNAIKKPSSNSHSSSSSSSSSGKPVLSPTFGGTQIGTVMDQDQVNNAQNAYNNNYGSSSSSSSGSSSGSVSGSSSGSSVDYGDTFWQSALQGGASSDYLQQIADARLNKAQNSSGLYQYANDQNQWAMQAYIDQLRQQENMQSELESYYDEMEKQQAAAYEQALARQQAAYQQAAENAAAQYKQLLPSVNQSYDDSARQAYIQYRLAQRDLPEQLAAAGISGQGAAESSLVAQNNAYNAAYTENELSRQNAIQNINNQAANAYANASTQGAMAASDILSQAAAAQQNLLSQQLSNRYNIAALQQQMQQNAINGLYNYAGLTGSLGGVPTLSGQQFIQDTAYNNAVLNQSQQQIDDSRKAELRQYYLSLYDLTGNSSYITMANRYI